MTERREIPDAPRAFTPFELVRSDRIYDSRWCGLRRDLVRIDGEFEREHHVIEISDAVAVVPLTAAGSVVLVGQYRYPHGKTHWEIPAGRLHANETPDAGAARELLEETGHRVGHLEALPGFYPINGISAHWAHAFVAHACEEFARPTLDETERLVVRVFTRGEVETLLDAGRFEDGFSALCLHAWLRRSGR